LNFSTISTRSVSSSS